MKVSFSTSFYIFSQLSLYKHLSTFLSQGFFLYISLLIFLSSFISICLCVLLSFLKQYYRLWFNESGVPNLGGGDSRDIQVAVTWVHLYKGGGEQSEELKGWRPLISVTILFISLLVFFNENKILKCLPCLHRDRPTSS